MPQKAPIAKSMGVRRLCDRQLDTDSVLSIAFHPLVPGGSMYLLFVPSMAAVVVIGFIQLRDQFAKLS